MNGKKILFFDDEALTSESLVKNLVTNFGHDITTVQTIHAFLEYLQKETYSLLMIDVMAPIPSDLDSMGFEKDEIEEMKRMEGMNTGVVLAKKVKKEAKYQNTPIIFLTAKAPFQLPWKDKCRIIRKPELAKNISTEIDILLKNNQEK